MENNAIKNLTRSIIETSLLHQVYTKGWKNNLSQNKYSILSFNEIQ